MSDQSDSRLAMDCNRIDNCLRYRTTYATILFDLSVQSVVAKSGRQNTQFIDCNNQIDFTRIENAFNDSSDCVQAFVGSDQFCRSRRLIATSMVATLMAVTVRHNR